jgi:hypothetical protein
MKEGTLYESRPDENYGPPESKITVAGVTFTADQVQSAVVKIDGREVHIQAKEDKPNKIGY